MARFNLNIKNIYITLKNLLKKPIIYFAMICGMLVAFITFKILTLNFRYLILISGVIVFLSIAMIMIKKIDEFIIYTFVFNIIFAMFGKWIMVQKIAVVAKGINLGLAEVLIFGAYFVWFFQIFVIKSKPLPKFRKIDIIIFLFIFFQFISFIIAPDKKLAIFDIIYNIKYILIYFFIANNIKINHLKIIIPLFLFAILFESAFAVFETTTGKVGIGLSKGNTQSEDYGRQYNVPQHNKKRAAGTTNDSHTLGLYFVMLLPIPLVFGLSNKVKIKIRLLMLGVFLVGLLGLIFTYSRSAMLCIAISVFYIVAIMLFYWKQKSVLVIIFAMLILASIVFPKVLYDIYDRFANAPKGIMSARYDTYYTALDIWKKNIFFGYGPGNYIDALNDPEIRGQTYMGDWEVQLPVHNSYLWVAADQGLFGLITFFSIIFISIYNCFYIMKRTDDIMLRCLFLAFSTAFIGYLFDGLTDPMFREPVPFSQLWITIGIIIAVKFKLTNNILKKQQLVLNN